MDTSAQLFPFAQYWWFYAAFTGLVLVLLALDLGVFHRRAREVTIREATAWNFFWIALSLAFNYLFYRYMLVAFAADPRLAAIPGFDAAADGQYLRAATREYLGDSEAEMELVGRLETSASGKFLFSSSSVTPAFLAGARVQAEV